MVTTDLHGTTCVLVWSVCINVQKSFNVSLHLLRFGIVNQYTNTSIACTIVDESVDPADNLP